MTITPATRICLVPWAYADPDCRLSPEEVKNAYTLRRLAEETPRLPNDFPLGAAPENRVVLGMAG